MRMSLVLTALAAALLPCAPAWAQETSQPPPIAPSDFRLPPGEGTQPAAEGPTLGSQPVRAATPTPTPTPSPRTAPSQTSTRAAAPVEAASPPGSQRSLRPTAAPTLTASPEPVAEAAEPAVSAEVGGSVPEGESVPAETGEAVFAPEVPPATAPDAGASGDSFGWPWLALLGALLAAAFGWLALRRRTSPQAEPVAQVLPHSEPAPAPAEPAEPAPEPIRDLPQPSFDPASLVSIRPRSASPAPSMPATPAAGSGLVTTNLAAKLRAEAEARRIAAERGAARQRPVVKGSITFDWS